MFAKWDRWFRVVLFIIIVCLVLRWAGEDVAAAVIGHIP